MAGSADLERAFDLRNPPDEGLLSQCVHCGFCLPTCPTYQLWHSEMDSPRGRIALMVQGLEPGSRLTPEMVEHFDACLGCMACVTACPSGVQYDKLIESTRAQVERKHRRPLRERFLRWSVFAVFTHPGRLRLAVPFLWLARVLRLNRLGERLPQGSPLRGPLTLAPSPRLRDAVARLPESWPPGGEGRGRVGMLQGCVQRVLFNDVNVATAEVLAAEGFEVHAPRLPRCCGALQLHSGEDAPARQLAKETIAAFEGCDYVVANAAGCGSALKDYAHLLADEPGWDERAAEFCARVRDVSELLAEHETRSPRHPVPIRIAYHDACHLAHAQGVRAQPRRLLEEIPDLDLVEPEDWSTCCGSAGIYNLVQPDAAEQLGRRKVANLLATGARTVAAANPGCALQIEAHSREAGDPVRVIHPIELIHRSMTGAGAPR